ncbi:ATP-binding protein [Pelagicoccus sp. SDUM812003]|uniref:ATP-binding protein n=1 Tax=Pelagicoccus sp. SDUM812003 TaxID=3041267 RepID=UPI00280CBF3F|nr:ATP-binding protein [Pelagicoccus sp. SDUM812003]MDQ8202614.1 ATP-binding protein [Pelagicoccus sp. SDUM812003]
MPIDQNHGFSRKRLLPNYLLQLVLLLCGPISVATQAAELLEDEFAQWGIPRTETFYPRFTGIRGDILNLSTLPNGHFSALTSIGIYTFDGTHWEHVPDLSWTSDSLTLPDGRTLVSFAAGLATIEPDEFGGYAVEILTPKETYPPNLPSMEHVAYAKGHCFGLAGTHLIIATPEGETQYHQLPNWATSIFAIGDDVYVTGGLTSLLNRWDWETRQLIDDSRHLDSSGVYEWFLETTPRAEGGVWIRGQQDTIIGFDGTRTWRWKGSTTLRKMDARISCFVEASPNTLAIGTSSLGALLIDENGEVLLQHTKQQGLDDVNVKKIGVDSQQGLWVRTSNSITRIPSHPPTVLFNEEHGLSDPIFTLEEFRDRIYIGTSTGLYTSNDEARSMDELFVRVLDREEVYHLSTYDEHLFISGAVARAMTSDGSIYLLDPDGATSFYQPSKYPDVMLGVNFRGITRYEKRNDRWTKIGRLEGPERDFLTIAESEDGQLFASTGFNKVALIELEEEVGSYRMIDLPINESGIWIALVTIDGEVYANGHPCLKWDSASREFVPDPQMYYYVGLPPYGFEHVYGRNEETAVVALDGRSSKTVPRPTRRIFGDISSIGNAIDTRAVSILYDHHGNLWAGGEFGLVFSNDPFRGKSSLEIRPRIHKITSTNDQQTFRVSAFADNPLILEPDQNSLEIAIEYPSLSATTHHQYQIVIEPLDEQSPPFSDSSRRSINNLPPGDYFIYANASDAYGHSSSSHTYHFTVKAPWYQKPWAYAAYLFGAILIVVGIVRYYNRFQIERSHQLEQLVRERTKEVEEKNEALKEQALKLETQNEELGEKTEELQSTTESLTETLHRLQEMQDQLMETARTAGKAEIATNVLHNVGNVLNSINVSLTVLSNKVSNSKVDRLSKLAKLLEANSENIESFLTQDPRGQKVPSYLIHLAQSLRDEVSEVSYELNTMEEDVEHVKRIIAAQQSHAKTQSLTQEFDLVETCETALTILGRDQNAHLLEINNELPEQLIVRNDKHRVLEIVLNLISNAIDAIGERSPELGILTLSYELDETNKRVRLIVKDNGVGISPENIDRLFNHGFTTKEHGHGFGLHSCANTARVLGGDLTITSEGLGKGATATLTLPIAYNT